MSIIEIRMAPDTGKASPSTAEASTAPPLGDRTFTRAPKINNDVPLPGVQATERITPLTIPREWFANGSERLGTSLLQLGAVTESDGKLILANGEALALFYRQVLPATARPSLRHVADLDIDVYPLLGDFGPIRSPDNGSLSDVALLPRRHVLAEPEDVDVQRRRRSAYINALGARASSMQGGSTLILPVLGTGQSIQHISVDISAEPAPSLALVETWELRSYLGDYGLGRTLQTFTLLPGESTTITVSTWRSASATIEDATSVFDSADVAAQSRFADTLTTTTGSASQDQGGWAVSGATSGKGSFSILWGLVSASADPLDANAAGNHQESSQRWSGDVNQAAFEHASQTNNSRQQAAQATSTTTTESGSATTTVRQISNTNLRRVLNFVFRELNQSYDTYVVLRNVKLAFYNGQPGSLDVAPLPEIQRFLRKYVDEPHQQETARFILALCAERLSANGDVVSTLQVGTKGAKPYLWRDVQLNGDGKLDFDDDPMSNDYRWRFKPGPLTADASREMDGLIASKSTVVLKTDNIIAEALLGQVDALDPYATALQELDLKSRDAEISWRGTQTRRTAEALDLVKETSDDKRVNAYKEMLVPPPQIEVVPVASADKSSSQR